MENRLYIDEKLSIGKNIFKEQYTQPFIFSFDTRLDNPYDKDLFITEYFEQCALNKSENYYLFGHNNIEYQNIKVSGMNKNAINVKDRSRYTSLVHHAEANAWDILNKKRLQLVEALIDKSN